MSDEIPFDTWTKISSPELEKKGKCAMVYRPSGNDKGPTAIDAKVEYPCNFCGTPDFRNPKKKCSRTPICTNYEPSQRNRDE